MRPEILTKITTSTGDQVNLVKMGIEDAEVKEIMQKINTLKPNVKDIFLSNNQISDAGAVIVGNECKSLKNLAFLDLQFNKIAKVGIDSILALKKDHPDFDCGLHGNLISDVGEIKEMTDAIAGSGTTLGMRR